MSETTYFPKKLSMSDIQRKKFSQGKTIELSPEKLVDGPYTFYLNKTQITKIEKCIAKDKGIRLHLSEAQLAYNKTHGDGILDSLRKVLGTVVSTAAPILGNLAGTALNSKVPGLGNIAGEVLNQGLSLAGDKIGGELVVEDVIATPAGDPVVVVSKRKGKGRPRKDGGSFKAVGY